MVLPFIAAFAKGAAEGAEEMLDQAALNRYEVASALKQAALDNPPGSIGPFTFKTSNKPGSYDYGQQQLNNLNAALGTQEGQAQFAAWVAQNDPSGNTIRREIIDAQRRWATQNQKTIRTGDGKPDAIISPSFSKTYPHIFNFVHGTQATLQAEMEGKPSGATLELLKRESKKRGFILPYNGDTSWATGMNLFPEAPPPSLPSGPLVTPAYTAGTEALTGTLELKRKAGMPSRIAINPSASIDDPSNADLKPVVEQINYGTPENPLYTSMARVLNEKNNTLASEKVAVANFKWNSLSQMPRKSQVAEVSRITDQIHLAHVERNFKPASVSMKQIAITPGQGSAGIVYDADAAMIDENSRDIFRKQIEDKNSAIAKQLEMRRYQYDANLKLVNITTVLLEYLENGVGNNMYDSFKKQIDGIGKILFEVKDDLFEDSESRNKYRNIEKEINSLTVDSDDIAVYAALERLTAFAMAQIVQNKTDKISNKDVDEMKEILGGPFRSKAQAFAVIAKFRSMALKSLARVGGFAGRTGARGVQSYEDYSAANAQYELFNKISPSIRNANSAMGYMQNSTTNMDSYGSAGSFKLGGVPQNQMQIYVEGVKKPPLQGYSNLASSIIYAYQDAVNKYDGSNEDNKPNWAKNVTIDKQTAMVRNIAGDSLDGAYRQNSKTKDLKEDYSSDLNKHALYIGDKVGKSIIDYSVLHIKDLGYMVMFIDEAKRSFFMQNESTVSIFANIEDLEKALKSRPKYEPIVIRQETALGGSISITDRLKGLAKNV